jgi:hypothetical protein
MHYHSDILGLQKLAQIGKAPDYRMAFPHGTRVVITKQALFLENYPFVLSSLNGSVTVFCSNMWHGRPRLCLLHLALRHR